MSAGDSKASRGTEPPPRVGRVGVILVHGIGEQRRFQHLDSQTRCLIDALQGMQQLKNSKIHNVGVSIAGTGAAAFQAERDTWSSGPDASVTIAVEHSLNGSRQWTELLIHEVWWADVNEPYSLAKQFRFWLWGLSLWALPKRPNAGKLATAGLFTLPLVPPPHHPWWDRARLFLIGIFFTLLAYSIGALTFIASRLFNWQAPEVLKTMANYVSGVKLYNQQVRYGPGLLWGHEDFLDTVGNPPRVSIRRRMIRTIADVACNQYDRWFVMAHSLGSVVAFNGLMEAGYAWPGYLDQERWARLQQHQLTRNINVPQRLQQAPLMPPRPPWVNEDEMAARPAIFAKFQGFLTYGSPLEKFAGLWPALVPISTEPAFPADARWFNILDPIDPVSGRLRAFQHRPSGCCPDLVEYGYAASWWLLLAHLKYWTSRRPGLDLASQVARWVLGAGPLDSLLDSHTQRGWSTGSRFVPGRVIYWGRTLLAWGSWILAAIILILLGAVVTPVFIDIATHAAKALWAEVMTVTTGHP